MLVVLKIPMVYLAVVVWWAIRAEPASGIEDDPPSAFVPLVPCDWNEGRRRALVRRRGLRPRPSGSRPRPTHGARTASAVSARR
jgi:hypothetical protein